MTVGVKHDSGKNRYDLIPALALEETVKVLTVLMVLLTIPHDIEALKILLFMKTNLM